LVRSLQGTKLGALTAKLGALTSRIFLQKMKKHFQRSSNEVDSVHWVEVECSKSGDTCGHFGGNGFPKVKMVEKGGMKFADYKGARNYVEMTPFAQEESKWKMKGELKWDVKAEL